MSLAYEFACVRARRVRRACKEWRARCACEVCKACVRSMHVRCACVACVWGVCARCAGMCVDMCIDRMHRWRRRRLLQSRWTDLHQDQQGVHSTDQGLLRAPIHPLFLGGGGACPTANTEGATTDPEGSHQNGLDKAHLLGHIDTGLSSSAARDTPRYFCKRHSA